MPPRNTFKMRPRKPATPAVRRPGVVTEEQKVAFLAAYEKSLSVVDAAAQADVSAADLKQAFRDDPEFYGTFRDVKTGVGERVQKAAIDRALQGDPAAMRIVLPALLPDVYGNKVTIDINVNSPDDLKQVSDEKLAEVKQACLKLQNS